MTIPTVRVYDPWYVDMAKGAQLTRRHGENLASRRSARGSGDGRPRVLAARGGELEQDFAFGVVRQLVEPLLAGASAEERAES